MGKRADQCKKIYVDPLRDRLKPTFLIHGPVHSLEKFKIINEFGTKYSVVGPFKEHRQDITTAANLKNN